VTAVRLLMKPLAIWAGRMSCHAAATSWRAAVACDVYHQRGAGVRTLQVEENQLPASSAHPCIQLHLIVALAQARVSPPVIGLPLEQWVPGKVVPLRVQVLPVRVLCNIPAVCMMHLVLEGTFPDAT